jgi:hypothetical protein
MEVVHKGWPNGELVVSMSRGRLTRTILVLLNFMLVLTIWLLWRNAPQPDSSIQVPGVETAPLQLPSSPLHALSPEHYQELVARPLFWTERRAVVSESPVPATTANQPLAFVLIGVVMSPQSKHALLSKPGSDEVLKVQPGDIVEGWQVESMAADSVTLSRGGERQQITLDEERIKAR